MKVNEINAIANNVIANFMADGYMINVLNKIHRNDSVILIKANGSKQDILMVKVEENHEWSIEKEYDLDTIGVYVYEFNGVDADFSGVLWEDKADSTVEVAKFYSAKGWGRNKWYTSFEEAIERMNKRHARNRSRHIGNGTVEISAERMSDNLLESVRSIRGFKRANRSNITIEKRCETYMLKFNFTNKSIAIDHKSGIRVR